MEWSAFFLGVASSVTAALVVFFFKAQVGNLVNVLFFKVYPKVSGVYTIKFKERVPKNQRDVLRLSQFGAKIWGTNETYEGDKLVAEDKIAGRVTASRFLLFDFESKTESHHNMGSGLFRMSSDSSKLTGYISGLCATCQNATSIEAVLHRIDKK